MNSLDKEESEEYQDFVVLDYQKDLEHNKKKTLQSKVCSNVQSELPVASFRTLIEDDNFINNYRRPLSYIRFTRKDEVVDHDEDHIDYEVDSEDEEWIDSFNSNAQLDSLAGEKCLNNNAIIHDHQTSNEDSFVLKKNSNNHILSYVLFEFLIDQLEKLSFADAQRFGFFSNPVIHYEELECSVCLVGDSDDLNQILFCDKCNLPVHQTCYGVRLIPEGAWYCGPCEEGIEAKNIQCILCGQTDGAFKKTERGEWVHSQCVLWGNVLQFMEHDCFGVAEYVDHVEPTKSSSCFLCKKTIGNLVECSKACCDRQFHVTCAQRSNLAVLIRERKKGLQRSAFCDQHTPVMWKRQESRRLKELKKKNQKNGKKRKFNGWEDIPISPRSIISTENGENGPSEECLRYCGGTTLDGAMEKILEVSSTIPEHLIYNVYKYWESKRKKRSGIPLLKRFHPSFVQRTTFQVPQAFSLKDLVNTYRTLKNVRENLEVVRTVLNQSRRRERLKSQMYYNLLKSYDFIFFPTRYHHKKILDHLIHADRDEFFVTNKLNVKEQEFYQRYSNPIDLSIIRERIDEGFYDNREKKFCDDIITVYENAIDFYPENSPQHFEAKRAKKICHQWIDEGDKIIDQGIPDLTFSISASEFKRVMNDFNENEVPPDRKSVV